MDHYVGGGEGGGGEEWAIFLRKFFFQLQIVQENFLACSTCFVLVSRFAQVFSFPGFAAQEFKNIMDWYITNEG